LESLLWVIAGKGLQRRAWGDHVQWMSMEEINQMDESTDLSNESWFFLFYWLSTNLWEYETVQMFGNAVVDVETRQPNDQSTLTTFIRCKRFTTKRSSSWKTSFRIQIQTCYSKQLTEWSEAMVQMIEQRETLLLLQLSKSKNFVISMMSTEKETFVLCH